MMRLALSLLWLVAMSVHADGLPAPVSTALKAAGVPADAVAVFVQRADQNKPLLVQHADQPMNPASTMKLLTTYAGLEILGPAYTWRTEFHSSVPVQGDVLNGDLILKGYGDPALTLENFWNLVRALRQKGVREIRGDLILDRGYFEEVKGDPALFDGEPYRAYNAGPDALLVNFKSTRFRFSGDAQSGKVAIAVDPDLPQLKVINNIELGHVPCADWKARVSYKVQRQSDTVTVTFGGNYSLACGEKILDLSVLDESIYIFQLFKQLWQEQGGVFLGNFREGSGPQGTNLLVAATSPPLADVIRLINKYSNNVMARQLLVSIGADQYGAPGSAESGARAVQGWLTGKGMNFPELVIENGAGLSRKERISARHLGELLLAAYASPVMPELISSLPIVGVDGTMQRRMKDGGVVGRGHFKTGSLDGVRAVAGYLLDAKGRRWVVVFMANHPAAGGTKAAQDALLEFVYARD
jgi:D-alanyl-D-alanine carboxypeptidase/D-alanyl-D-alanine-endopeptidase (penicillin-binding protein 4)